MNFQKIKRYQKIIGIIFLKELVKTIYLLDELDEDNTKHILRHLANDDVDSGSEILAAELATKIDRFDFAIQIAKLL